MTEGPNGRLPAARRIGRDFLRQGSRAFLQTRKLHGKGKAAYFMAAFSLSLSQILMPAADCSLIDVLFKTAVLDK